MNYIYVLFVNFFYSNTVRFEGEIQIIFFQKKLFSSYSPTMDILKIMFLKKYNYC